MGVDQLEEDQDSLFGSPPPSPTRGRSPSPALALPSASSSTQNVGTIALPGSHPYSELPVNPLALSSSLALGGPHPRPSAPLQPINGVGPYLSQVFASSSSNPSCSRSSSAGPSFRSKKKQPKKSKSKESTPRPAGPEIALPDPSDPPPANFLRNQSALLGTAGLVGGVKPSNLSIPRYTRGANPSNPIIVEDEDEPPVLGRASKFRHAYTHPVDASLLPTPSTQDVVAMLIGQKDIFPVLESILRLIASGSSPQSPPPSKPAQTATRPISSQTLPPPTKKRKLNRVPAGASDWDVPYPFPQGEGPDAYMTTWERERGKQLISQLVSLIKNAAKKAATKRFLQNEEAKRVMMEAQRTSFAQAQGIPNLGYSDMKIHGHYRPSTITYGLKGEAALTAYAQVQEVLSDASHGQGRGMGAPVPSLYQPVQFNPGGVYQSIYASSSKSGPQPSTPFDQLISSLLAASPGQVVPSSGDSSENFNTPDVDMNIAAPVNAENTPIGGSSGVVNGDGVDQGLFNSWMNILQTFPMPSGGFEDPQAPEHHHAPQFTANGGDELDFVDISGDSQLDTNDATVESHVPPIGPPKISSSSIDLDSQITALEGSTNVPLQIDTDYLMDPALLSISIPQPPHTTNDIRESTTPSLAPSPMPSMSSFGDYGPATPNSATWDSMPEVFTSSVNGNSGDDNGSSQSEGMLHRALWNSMLETYRLGRDGAEEYINSSMGAQGINESSSVTRRWDKGKGRDMGHMVLTPQAVASTAEFQRMPSIPSRYRALVSGYTGLVTSMPTLQTAPVKLSPPTDKALNKRDILRRAEERKRKLKEELDKIKTQLWETTIEQGALAYLSRHYI